MLDDSLSAGRLDPKAASPTVTLADDDLADALARKKGRLDVGDRFAGYQIRGLLGYGAMGHVYEAWDASEERRVSLKLVRAPTQRSAERLLRESRALARIDHPNVVRILAADVHRGAVYLTMELVEGQDLREWMQGSHSWQEVVSVLLGAGRGLAAAHAAGILHRDFKPENVLVGWDGQARVLDFGIARMSPEHPEHETMIEEADEDAVEELALAEGEGVCGSAPLVGSFANMSVRGIKGEGEARDSALRDAIAYMAPEQHERERADERSDQFGFCATLFEAIYGAHPFPSKDARELVARAGEGRIELPAQASAKAPRWLAKVLERGLAPRRADRFETMEDLLEALERYPGRRRKRRRVAGFVGAAVVLAGVAGLGVAQSAARTSCPGRALLEQQLGASVDSRLSEQLHGARGPLLPLAEAFVQDLDAWSQGWLEQREQSCELGQGARLERVEAEAIAGCLDAQLAQVSALVELASAAEAEDFGWMLVASPGLSMLPEPAVCQTEAGRAYHAALVESDSPLEAEQRAALARSSWRGSLWPSADALPVAEQLQAHAQERGAALASLQAGLARGRLLLHAGEVPAAIESLREGLREAERLANDPLRAELGVALGRALAQERGRELEAIALLDDVEAVLDRVAAPAWLRARHGRALASALLDSAQHERARAQLEALLFGERGSSLGELERSEVQLQLARALLAQGETEAALRETALARTQLERLLGPDHPQLAGTYAQQGRLERAMGDEEGASATFERSVALYRQPSRHASAKRVRTRARVRALVEHAELAAEQGEDARAADAYREALGLLPEALQAERARLLLALAHLHELEQRHEQALANFRESLRLAEGADPRDGQLVLRARFGLARALLATGEISAGRFELERCRADWPPELAEDPEAVRLATTLAQLDAESSGPEDPESP